MIKTLVKIANLLDKRGHYKTAREVDEMIEKLAQQSFQPDPNQSVQPDPTQSFQPPRQSNKTLQSPEQWMLNQQRKYDEEATGPRNMNRTPLLSPEKYRALKQEEYGNGGMSVQPGPNQSLPTQQSFQPASTPSSAAPVKSRGLSGGAQNMVKQMQGWLGIPETGKWDAATNTAFTSASRLGGNPEFKGNLTQAHTLMSSLYDKNLLPKNRNVGIDPSGNELPFKTFESTASLKTPFGR